MVFKQDTFNKIESKIILHYHSIEKGFIHQNFKHRFGKQVVTELIKLLNLDVVIDNHKKSQIAAAYMVICKYYEKHKNDGVDISDYYDNENYQKFRRLLTIDIDITKDFTVTNFFENSQSDFLRFAQSRSSVRDFTNELVLLDTIYNAINLAKTAPSVCNRQPIKVLYTENKPLIDRIFALQQGLKGYSQGISQLLVLVSDRNYFYTVGERNQLYIDGGIFLMNLLYSLHFYKVAACPAHWGFNYQQDRIIKTELNLSESDKVICLLPIGIPKAEFKTTLSCRRENDEILFIVK